MSGGETSDRADCSKRRPSLSDPHSLTHDDAGHAATVSKSHEDDHTADSL